MQPEVLAFLLTLGAGGATSIGAVFPFFFKTTNFLLLAAAMSFSAGVMTYVSFIEIFLKSKEAFVELNGETHATLSTVGCFFGGWLFASLLDFLVHLMDPEHTHDFDEINLAGEKALGVDPDVLADADAAKPLLQYQSVESSDELLSVAKEPSKDFENEAHPGSRSRASTSRSRASTTRSRASTTRSQALSIAQRQITTVSFWRHPITWIKQDWAGFEGMEGHVATKEGAKLKKTGFITGLAVGIHNFPEGLATFVGALADPEVGIVLAIAIAIHNIPEGICVAMPIYFSTGSRLKAFMWASLSGISEPIGAGLGWAIISIADNDIMFGILFGLVGGMMVFISVKELLPTSHRYDPEDKYVSWCFFLGMLVMASSLLLFEY